MLLPLSFVRLLFSAPAWVVAASVPAANPPNPPPITYSNGACSRKKSHFCATSAEVIEFIAAVEYLSSADWFAALESGRIRWPCPAVFPAADPVHAAVLLHALASVSSRSHDHQRSTRTHLTGIELQKEKGKKKKKGGGERLRRKRIHFAWHLVFVYIILNAANGAVVASPAYTTQAMYSARNLFTLTTNGMHPTTEGLPMLPMLA